MTQKFLISVVSYIHENVDRNCQLVKTISPLNMIWAFLFPSLSNGLSDSKQMQITQSQSLNSSQKTIQILLFVIPFLSIQFLISCKYGAKIS